MTSKLTLAQHQLHQLRAANAALRDTPDQHARDAGWDLADAALIAAALTELASRLPAIITTVKTAIDHDGTPVEVDGYLAALAAAQQLAEHTQRLAQDLDPHYGPHGRHPHRPRPAD